MNTIDRAISRLLQSPSPGHILSPSNDPDRFMVRLSSRTLQRADLMAAYYGKVGELRGRLENPRTPSGRAIRVNRSAVVRLALEVGLERFEATRNYDSPDKGPGVFISNAQAGHLQSNTKFQRVCQYLVQLGLEEMEAEAKEWLTDQLLERSDA